MSPPTAGRRSTFQVPPERQDRLVAELWHLGTRGIHLRQAGAEEVVDAYFAAADDHDLTAHLAAAAAMCGARLLTVEEVADEDWSAAYRERTRPFRVGPFLLAPGEPEEGEPALWDDDAILLRVPARNAFGTGSHESTRLVLEEMPGLALCGMTVLDVGTGSGILAFAALRLGARHAVGLDLDTGSVVTARDNAHLNRLAPAFFAGTLDALGGSFDCVLVNILPERWLAQAGAVVARLAASGTLVISGLLAEQRYEVLASLASLPLVARGERQDGEWLALRLEREPDRGSAPVPTFSRRTVVRRTG